MSFTVPIWLIFIHFVADFFLQSDWMALNKSKSFFALSIHCWVYSVCFLWAGAEFFTWCYVTHAVTDALTSRLTTRLWLAKQRHWFFVVIGADQLIHYVTLALLWRWLIV